MRILLDTNVVLDVFLARQPFVLAASELFGLAERARIEGLLCATTITTIDYLLHAVAEETRDQEAIVISRRFTSAGRTEGASPECRLRKWARRSALPGASSCAR